MPSRKEKILKTLLNGEKKTKDLLEDLGYEKDQYHNIMNPLDDLEEDGYIEREKGERSGRGRKPKICRVRFTPKVIKRIYENFQGLRTDLRKSEKTIKVIAGNNLSYFSLFAEEEELKKKLKRSPTFFRIAAINPSMSAEVEESDLLAPPSIEDMIFSACVIMDLLEGEVEEKAIEEVTKGYEERQEILRSTTNFAVEREVMEALRKVFLLLYKNDQRSLSWLSQKIEDYFTLKQEAQDLWNKQKEMKSNDEEINERTRELYKRMENIAKEVLPPLTSPLFYDPRFSVEDNEG